MPDVVELRPGYTSFTDLTRYGLEPIQRELLGAHADTQNIEVFSTVLVPGILQTPDYAEARLTEAGKMLRVPVDDVEAAVDARMKHGELLQTRRCHFVLHENVLRTATASPAVMRAQLVRLLAYAEDESTMFGVIEASTRCHAPLHAFWMLDGKVVEVETFSGRLEVDDPEEVALYARLFAQFGSLAAYGDDALDLIGDALDYWAGK
jgi:hypothetical protein